MKTDYEAVIGLEIHVQLNSATKMFCNCPNRPGDQPNKNTCPICLGLPGAIPQFSQEVLEKAALTCLGLNCEVQHQSAFDQKVYYYPDLPKGFQLSQFHKPLARNGRLDIASESGLSKRVRIREIHMEEDVAKLIHETEARKRVSLVDFNRAGAPLAEIVTEPDLRSSQDAVEFIRALRRQIRYIGSSECSMEKGTLRVDANISLRAPGSSKLNTKVEVKNMNSTRSLGDAIGYEITRQALMLKAGEPIVLHTRLWDPEKCVTEAMRGKFEGPCVPDPSVAQIVITDEWLEKMRSRLPEMPGRKVERFVKQHGLTYKQALLMCSERDLSEYFEAVIQQSIPPRSALHWISSELLPALKERNQALMSSPITPERFAGLLIMVERKEVNARSAKDLLARLFSSNQTPETIAEQCGFKQVSDTAELELLIDQVIAANASAVDDFRNGKDRAKGFLIGQVMKASEGRADPGLVQEILMRMLSLRDINKSMGG